MKAKLYALFAIVVLGILAAVSIASAASVPVSLQEVYINDRLIESGETRAGLERSDTVDIEVRLFASGNEEFVTLRVDVDGYDKKDRNLLKDEADVFSIEENKTYFKKFQIKVPTRVDEDVYLLRITATNRQNDAIVYTANLKFDPPRDGMWVRDVIFNPTGSVKAGRALLTTVRLENIGEDDDDDGIKVEASIPKLGVSAADFVDEIEKDDSVTSEELYMRIPECAEAGEYDVMITVTFDDGDKQISDSRKINVEEGDCPAKDSGKTVISVATDAGSVVAGESAIFPLTLSNTGKTSKTYTIEAVADWAAVTVNPSNVVVLSSGETKTLFVTAATKKDASAGQKSLTLSVKSGDEVLKEIALKVNVAESKSSSLKQVLQITFIVLLVIVVVLVLVFGFRKMKEGDKEEETYY